MALVSRYNTVHNSTKKIGKGRPGESQKFSDSSDIMTILYHSSQEILLSYDISTEQTV